MTTPQVRQDIHNSSIPALCMSCEARHQGVCGTLSPAQLSALAKHTKRRMVEAGHEVTRQGEDTPTYSNVLKGVVKLSKVMSDGRQQIVGLQFAPDFIGRPYSRTSSVAVEAASNTVVCSFPRDVMERLVVEEPHLGHKLHEQALKELDDARDWMLALGRKDAQEKIASLLCYLASHLDPEAGVTTRFELPLSRMEIADYLGLTIETVSRQFTKLRKLGLIVVENSRIITIPDLNRLAAVAGFDLS